MSRTHKHQATYDYLHKNKAVAGRLLRGNERYFNRCYFKRYDYDSRNHNHQPTEDVSK